MNSLKDCLWSQLTDFNQVSSIRDLNELWKVIDPESHEDSELNIIFCDQEKGMNVEQSSIIGDWNYTFNFEFMDNIVNKGQFNGD